MRALKEREIFTYVVCDDIDRYKIIKHHFDFIQSVQQYFSGNKKNKRKDNYNQRDNQFLIL